MSNLNFNDGVNLNTSGELRPLQLSDGWYVVGHGMLIPVDGHKEALELILTLKSKLKHS